MERNGTRLAIVAVLSWMALSGCAFKRSYSFEVLSAETGEPIAGATCLLLAPRWMILVFGPLPKNVIGLTDENGICRLTSRGIGGVIVAAPGYVTTRGTLEGEADGSPKRILSAAHAPGELNTNSAEREPLADYSVSLQWSETPTVSIEFPRGFKGLFLLESGGPAPSLPAFPIPRAFSVNATPNGFATVPAFERGDVRVWARGPGWYTLSSKWVPITSDLQRDCRIVGIGKVPEGGELFFIGTRERGYELRRRFVFRSDRDLLASLVRQSDRPVSWEEAMRLPVGRVSSFR